MSWKMLDRRPETLDVRPETGGARPYTGDVSPTSNVQRQTPTSFYYTLKIMLLGIDLGTSSVKALLMTISSSDPQGVVLSDANGQPLYPAILWADTRASELLYRYHAILDLQPRLANPITTRIEIKKRVIY